MFIRVITDLKCLQKEGMGRDVSARVTCGLVIIPYKTGNDDACHLSSVGRLLHHDMTHDIITRVCLHVLINIHA